LLLIRLAAGASLIIDGLQNLESGFSLVSVILGLLAIGDGGLFVVGLWTPVVGIVVFLLSGWEILFRHYSAYPGILLSAMGIGISLVGPGVHSVDARLFGWKRIDIED
jgi:hypothetical protein